MHYLFLGEDNSAKDRQIDTIKKDVFSNLSTQATINDAHHFDFQVLDGHKCDPAELKKALIELPVIAPKKVLLIRNVHKLAPHNKELIIDILEQDPGHLVLILDTFASDLKNAFFKKLSRLTKVSGFSSGRGLNVFDMSKAISSRNPVEALKMLQGLLYKGDHPLQIMGGLIWSWGKNRNRLSKEDFHQGLVLLQEADLNIKRTRMNSENALELLIVKLCSLAT